MRYFFDPETYRIHAIPNRDYKRLMTTLEKELSKGEMERDEKLFSDDLEINKVTEKLKKYPVKLVIDYVQRVL